MARGITMSRWPVMAVSTWIALAAPVLAHELTAGDVVIDHPHAHATVAVQKNGAAYMIIRNRGSAPERLLAVRTNEARSAEVHGTTITPEGVAQMRRVEAINIPPDGEVRLAPGGLHVMLTGLKGPLVEGTSFPMTLVFARAGEVGVEVMVDGANAGHDGHGGRPDAAASAVGPGTHGDQAEGGHGAPHGN
jgi:copper(I)-binding protein